MHPRMQQPKRRGVHGTDPHRPCHLATGVESIAEACLKCSAIERGALYLRWQFLELRSNRPGHPQHKVPSGPTQQCRVLERLHRKVTSRSLGWQGDRVTIERWQHVNATFQRCVVRVAEPRKQGLAKGRIVCRGICEPRKKLKRHELLC